MTFFELSECDQQITLCFELGFLFALKQTRKHAIQQLQNKYIQF